MDILADYVNVLYDLFDAPRIFLIASGYHLLSSTLGNYIVCPWIVRPYDNPWKPNLWVMISGLPGISRKSTVIGIERSVLFQSFITYYKLKNPNLLEKDIRQYVSDMILQTGSPEGITDHISEKQDTIDRFIIMSAEWGGVIRQMRGAKNYMEGLINLLSSLYSAEDFVWRGAKKVRYIKPGLFVTAIVGIQEPKLYLDKFMLEQGLLRRFLLVYATPKDKDRWYPALDLRREFVFDRLEPVSKTLGELMLEYEQKSPVIANFDSNVREAINEFNKLVEQQMLSDPYSPWSLYAQSLWEHLVKLVILTAVSRKRPEPTGGMGYSIYVDKYDLEFALRYVKEIEPNMRLAISSIGAPEIEAPLVNYSTVLDRVYSIIVNAGPSGITFSELLRATRILKKELIEYIKNLMDEGRVEAFIYRPRRGRPSIILVSTSYNTQYAERILKSKKINSQVIGSYL